MICGTSAASVLVVAAVAASVLFGGSIAAVGCTGDVDLSASVAAAAVLLVSIVVSCSAAGSVPAISVAMIPDNVSFATVSFPTAGSSTMSWKIISSMGP